MEVIAILIGFVILLTVHFLITHLSNTASGKKIAAAFLFSGQEMFSILNRRCSVKRINKARGRAIYYRKCNCYVGSDFLIIQGINNVFFKSYVTTFAVALPGSAIHKSWEGSLFKLVNVELGTGKKEVKIVYKTTYFNESVYSLIISNLTPVEFEHLSVVKQWV